MHRLFIFYTIAAAASGCVRVYQPMSGLHRPVVVDTQAPNFKDVRITVHCVPGDLLSRGAARELCEKVGTLFRNQGASVKTIRTVGRAVDTLDGVPEENDEPKEQPPDLTLELRSRRTHLSKYPLSWLLCFASFTVVPGVTEYSFAQDVIIRDGSGFLLVRDTLTGQIISQFGVGVTLGNMLLNFTRKKQNKLTTQTLPRELSADLYGQLSQLMFNADMHRRILEESVVGQR